MQCSSIPKRHEEGAFVARFGIEYIYVYSKGIILNRSCIRVQWKRSDFDKSFFKWIERYSHTSTMSNIRTVIQQTFVQKYKVKRQNNSNKVRCSILQRTKLTFFFFLVFL